MKKAKASLELKDRNSSIELLKIVAILLIICSHVVQTLGSADSSLPFQDYVVNLATATTDISRLILTMLRYSGALGNTLFFICSAWFLLDSKRASKEKIITMLLDIWIISVIILGVMLCLKRGDIPLNLIIKSLLPTTFANNWYLTCYLLFYPIHPILNKIIGALTQKELLRVAVILSVLYIGFNYISSFFFPSALILWVTIYFDMAYLKIYMEDCLSKTRVNIAMLIVGLAGNCGIVILTNYLGLQIPFFESKLLHWNNNCSPFLILIALAAFNLARQRKFANPAINGVSKLSLLIYIIHENIFLRSYFRPMMWQYIYETFGYKYIVLWVFAMVAVIFAVSLIASVAYQLTLHRVVKIISKRLAETLAKAYNLLENRMVGEN